MKVLVTGADGYIGSVLSPLLIERGVDVVGLDCGYYREGWLFNPAAVYPGMISKDLRQVEPADLEGFDAVVHLAELSNDPLGQNDPQVTYAINHKGSVRLIEAARSAGVERFVYASSCSVYGAGGGEAKTETDAANPQTAYAECKVLVENDLMKRVDGGFAGVCLRNSTAFGASPRQRFDVVLNNLCGVAWTTREIKMTSDGSPWRPLVHILDISEAVYQCLKAPRETINGQILNVGADEQNYRVREIAEIVSETFPGCTTSFGSSDGDTRSYRVDFSKIRRTLPDFTCRWTAPRGAEQLRRVFESIGMTPEIFAAPPFTRLKELRRLIELGRLDADLFWRPI